MSNQHNSNNRWYLLNKLKNVVKKVTFLMNSNISKWRIVSSFKGAGGGAGRGRLSSFNERLGLTMIVSSSDDELEEEAVCDSGSCARELKSTKSFRVERTRSFPQEDDIDKRADMFIENFYRQLRMERQVSLQLSKRSKEDDVQKISTFVFVTNFPDGYGAKNFWNTCKLYGHVVDVFISDRRTKAGKRFDFVRFIKVLDIDRLINNLCTIWVGRNKIHANVARFQREPLHKQSNNVNNKGTNNVNHGAKGMTNSYAHVVKGNQVQNVGMKECLNMVLNETCLNHEDFSLCLLGKVNEFASLTNLKVVLGKELYVNIELKYMGGFWVMIVFQDDETKKIFQFNLAVGSWFFQIIHAHNDFVIDERVIWVEVEGVPFKWWSRNTFNRIASRWDGEEGYDVNDGSHEDDMYGGVSKNLKAVKGESDREKVPETNFEEVHDKSIFEGHSVGRMMFILMIRLVFMRGSWVSSGKRLLIISVYAPQDLSEKKMLWDYLSFVIGNWNGKVVIMGDFNEVRDINERFGSIFNKYGAEAFNSFIVKAGLVEVPLGGCSFTWCHKSAKKMSILDCFLISDNLMCSCPSISSTSSDRFLSDHQPIIMQEAHYDYGPIPFKFFHYWFELDGFDKLVEHTWLEANVNDQNSYSKFMNKLKYLKEKIRIWARLYKESLNSRKIILKAELADLDGVIDKGEGSDADGHQRREVVRLIQEVEKVDAMKVAQKAKIKWSIEGDENSKYYHGMLNKRENDDLGRKVSNEEIKKAVWDCEIPKGGNSSFITLIPKMLNANMVKDFRPISLIRSLYKVIAKVLANRLVTVLDDIVDEIQSAFVMDRQIMYGPFILNEIVHWCKNKKKQSMIFKVDFEKAYDSARWDFIDDILRRCDPDIPYVHFKVPMNVHQNMESIRARFFNGADANSKKSSWVRWKSVLAAKDVGGLGVRVVKALHGEDEKIGKNVQPRTSTQLVLKVVLLFLTKRTMYHGCLVFFGDGERDVNVNETFHEQTDDELS
nr:RNA-directed DNA polymerase, eukaryota, reverse transcriptase zinc-binding domain protein [Tanacetum cinerariifolium]